jgi:hypothetical protein
MKRSLVAACLAGFGLVGIYIFLTRFQSENLAEAAPVATQGVYADRKPISIEATKDKSLSNETSSNQGQSNSAKAAQEGIEARFTDLGNLIRLEAMNPSTDPSMRRGLLATVWVCKRHNRLFHNSEEVMRKDGFTEEQIRTVRAKLDMDGRSCQTLAPQDYEIARQILVTAAIAGEPGMALSAVSDEAFGKNVAPPKTVIEQIYRNALNGDSASMSTTSQLEPPADFDKVDLLAIRIASFMRGNRDLSIGLSMEQVVLIAKMFLKKEFTDAETTAAIALAKVLLQKSEKQPDSPR